MTSSEFCGAWQALYKRSACNAVTAIEYTLYIAVGLFRDPLRFLLQER